MNLQEYRDGMLDRFIGIFSLKELKILSEAVICGAGAGGVGGWTYLNLARLGCENFKIADPNYFNPSNVNRQAGANFETVGQNKAEVISKEINKINPNAYVEVWNHGVTSDTIRSFIEGANIVIDAIDLYELEIKKLLYDVALQRKIPVISTPILGFGSALAVFHPLKSPSFEQYFGAIPSRSNRYEYNRYIRTLATGFFGFKPKLNWDVYDKRLDAGKVPSVGISCLLAGALAATASIDYLLDKGNIPLVPSTIHIDLMQQKIVRTGSLRRWLLRKYVQSPLWKIGVKKSYISSDANKDLEFINETLIGNKANVLKGVKTGKNN